MDERKDLEEILKAERKGRRWLLGVVAILVLLSATVLLMGLRNRSRASVQYRTEKVLRGSLTVTVSATGTLKPKNQVEVGSEISGTIRSIEADFNDRVHKGQVLARLDTEKLEAELLQAQATLEAREASLLKAEVNLKLAQEKLQQMLRAWELSGHMTPSLSDIEAQRAQVELYRAEVLSAKAQVDEARAIVKQKESELSKAIIRSPIDGMVLGRHVEVGQTVIASQQTPVLFTLTEDLTEMELILDVDEADIAQVKEGQRALFTVDAYPERQFEGSVKEVRFYPKTSEGVVTYEVVLSVDNPQLLLRPGMTANAEIVVKEVKDALLVPNAALRFKPPIPQKEDRRGFTYMFLPRFPRRQIQGEPALPKGKGQIWVLEEGKPRAIEVRFGPSDGQYTQVISEELEPGMEVITGVLIQGK